MVLTFLRMLRIDFFKAVRKLTLEKRIGRSKDDVLETIVSTFFGENEFLWSFDMLKILPNYFLLYIESFCHHGEQIVFTTRNAGIIHNSRWGERLGVLGISEMSLTTQSLPNDTHIQMHSVEDISMQAWKASHSNHLSD